MPYCPRCGTPLSSHEIAQGYQEVEDYSAIVKFELEERKNTYLLVWTTTPWTLVSNAAAAVNAKSIYVEVEYEGQNLILVKDLLDTVFGKDHPFKQTAEYKGSELVGKTYKPVYDYAGENEEAF